MKNILLIITNPIEFFKKNSKKKFLKYGISIWLLNTFWLITNYILLKLDLINYKLIFLDINNLVSLIVSIVLSLFAIIIIVVITNSIVILFKGKNKFINLLVAHLLIGIISILFIPLNIIFYFLKSSLLLRISNYIVGIWQIILSFCAIIGVYNYKIKKSIIIFFSSWIIFIILSTFLIIPLEAILKNQLNRYFSSINDSYIYLNDYKIESVFLDGIKKNIYINAELNIYNKKIFYKKFSDKYDCLPKIKDYFYGIVLSQISRYKSKNFDITTLKKEIISEQHHYLKKWGLNIIEISIKIE